MNELWENNYYNNGKGEIKITGTKCAEIFTTENEFFNVLCTFCGTILKDIEGFTLHFKKNHSKQFEHKEIKTEELPNDDTLIDPIGQHKLEVSNASEESILENIIEFVDESDLQNESNDLKGILERNIRSRDTIELVDGVIPVEEKSSNDLNKEPVKECNSSSKPKMSEDKTNSSEQTKESSTRNKSRKISRSRVPTFYVCNICNKVFKQEPILKSHVKYDHNTTYSFVDNLNNREGNQEGDEFYLDPVQSIANDPLKCRYCDRRFKKRLHRFEHECLHTGEKPYKCTFCEKTFRLQNTLKTHTRVHENKKEFKCHICDKGFNIRKNLTMHLRRHNNEKPYKCSYCNKGFVQNSDKKNHERIHTGEKPYKCDFCDKAFQRRCAFSEHKKLHSDEFRYTCNI